MAPLLLLFIALPAIELYLLIRVGGILGPGFTIALIVLTGIVGASMARRQGLRVLSDVQRGLDQGQLPASSVLDGLMILISAALLVTPGILTDGFGFLLLLPAFRRVVRTQLLRRFERAVAEQRVHVHVAGFDATGPGAGGFRGADASAEGGAFQEPESLGGTGPIIDIEPGRSRRSDSSDG